MKVASYNIHKCRGVDGRVRPERIISVVKELCADLVALQVVLLRRSRMKQTKALLDAFLGLKPMPTIMLGDFNEWRRVRRSTFAVLEPVFGSLPVLSSFPSRRPFFPMDRILDWPPGLITYLTVHNIPLARLVKIKAVHAVTWEFFTGYLWLSAGH